MHCHSLSRFVMHYHVFFSAYLVDHDEPDGGNERTIASLAGHHVPLLGSRHDHLDMAKLATLSGTWHVTVRVTPKWGVLKQYCFLR